MGHRYLWRHIEYKFVEEGGGGAFPCKRDLRMPNCQWPRLNHEWQGHVASQSHLKSLNKVGAEVSSQTAMGNHMRYYREMDVRGI